ncbi:MAG: four helix bundle protein [Patescibacteria group bacterium]
MSNQIQSSNVKRIYDLEERTAKFGEAIIEFAKTIKRDEITKPILNQLIKSATSIGANYCEADGAESGKDFKHKIGICKKEAKETKYWLRIMAKAVPAKIDECRVLWKEAQELTLIFSSMVKKKK